MANYAHSELAVAESGLEPQARSVRVTYNIDYIIKNNRGLNYAYNSHIYSYSHAYTYNTIATLYMLNQR